MIRLNSVTPVGKSQMGTSTSGIISPPIPGFDVQMLGNRKARSFSASTA